MEKRTKWWQYPLLPFLVIFDYSVKLLIYLLYVQSRILKSPLTKTKLYGFEDWNEDDEYAINERKKDISLLTIIWSIVHVWIWLPWYYLLCSILVFAVIIIAVIVKKNR
jgi:hypothetical protein